MGENPNIDELNVDYLIALTTIRQPLDEDMCADFSSATDRRICTEMADAQFYYVDESGERCMTASCWSCLVPAIRDLAEKGQKIIVEVPA